MSRALIAEWRTVKAADWPVVVEEWRVRRDALAASHCHYWIFASPDAPERVLEFTEARDAATLRAGRASAGLGEGNELILTEVELG